MTRISPRTEFERDKQYSLAQVNIPLSGRLNINQKPALVLTRG